MTPIRIARPNDFELVLPLLKARHAETGRGTFDPHLVRDRFYAMTDEYGVGMVGVIEGTKCAEATIGLTVCQFWDSRERHLEALWQYVGADFRRSDHAKRLVLFAKGIANRMGLPLFSSEAETPETAPKVRLLERNMQRDAVIFRHEPAHV